MKFLKLKTAVVIAFSLTALSSQADVYEPGQIQNETSGVNAFKEFDSMRNQFELQGCLQKSKICKLKKDSSISYIKQNSSASIVGFTVQETYSKRLSLGSIRRCMSELHSSDLNLPTQVAFGCFTEVSILKEQ